MRSIISAETRNGAIDKIFDLIRDAAGQIDPNYTASLFIMGSFARDEPTLLAATTSSWLLLSDLDLLLVSTRQNRADLGNGIRKIILEALDENRFWKCTMDVYSPQGLISRLEHSDIYAKSALQYHQQVWGRRIDLTVTEPDLNEPYLIQGLNLVSAAFNLNVALENGDVDTLPYMLRFDSVYHCLHKLAKSIRALAKAGVCLERAKLATHGLPPSLETWSRAFQNTPKPPTGMKPGGLPSLLELAELRDGLRNIVLEALLPAINKNGWEDWTRDLVAACELNWIGETNNITQCYLLTNRFELITVNNATLPRW